MPKLVPWYLGNDFLPCVKYIQMLCLIIFPMITSNILRSHYFIALQKDKEYIFSVISSSLINIILNLMLIKSFGVLGVIVGSLGSEVFAMLYLIKKTKNIICYKELIILSLKFMSAAVIMGIGILIIGAQFEASIVTNIIQIIIGGIIYLFFLWILFIRKKINFCLDIK